MAIAPGQLHGELARLVGAEHVLEGAGRRQLRLWAGGDGSSEEVVAALERLQERFGDDVVQKQPFAGVPA